MNIYRHGDLSFHKYEGKTGELVEVKHTGSFTLALGEHTGHKHVISAPKGEMRIFKDSEGNYVLEISKKAELVHEEHHAITFEPGVYKMKTEREYDYFLEEVKQVQD